ncbi:MAG TPA: hypothetical protein PKC87_05600 [Candidatus Absconditabacterales bacterium]|nr:hypothetical protein [Candidatus Absconditabacterales bacterium]
MMYEVALMNGDSIKVELSYATNGCTSRDTLFDIGSRFTPELMFSSSEVCFGDSTTIINHSIFDKGLSNVNIFIEGISQNFTSKNDFKCFIDQNNEQRDVFVEIDQQGCFSRDTFIINNKLKPKATFDFKKTCENEFQVINNLSSNTTMEYTVSMIVNNRTYSYTQGASYTLTDTLPDKNYVFSIKITNNNGCMDTISYQKKIDPVTYVSFTGLATAYCEKQDTSVLIGSQQGGSFSGQFIENILPGRAFFKPLFDTINLPIVYTFTNTFGCTDTEIKTVLIVNPKPNLSLSGLLSAYCEKDASSELSINQIIENNSNYSIFRDGTLVDTSTGIKFDFDPFVPGNYNVVNYYIDQNNCFNEIENQTIVNPLPKIDLDSVAIIKPGDFITIGNNLQNEPNVIFTWSNGDTQSFTTVDQPGLYLLEAVNSITGCMVSDTISIKYDKNIKQDLFNIKIFPNPTVDILNIELQKFTDNIKIFKLDGSPIIINGTSTFSTSPFGNLEIDMTNLEIGYYCIKIPAIGDFFILKI